MQEVTIDFKKAHIIKTDLSIAEASPANGTDFSLEELQKVVDGYIEVLYFNGHEGPFMVLNDEGKLRELPENPIATMIARNFDLIGMTDCIVGDVVVIPPGQLK